MPFLLLVSFFYFNTYFLIRKLFLPGKLFYYLLTILGCLVFISAAHLIFSDIIDTYVPSEFHHPGFLHRLFFPVFPALFVFAEIATPVTDPIIAPLVVMIPLALLYEASIVVAVRIEAGRLKKSLSQTTSG